MLRHPPKGPPRVSRAGARASNAVDRYVRCATCAKIVVARAQACPFGETALAPETPVSTPPLIVPRRDSSDGCLFAAMVFLAFVVLLIWLLGPSPPRR